MYTVHMIVLYLSRRLKSFCSFSSMTMLSGMNANKCARQGQEWSKYTYYTMKGLRDTAWLSNKCTGTKMIKLMPSVPYNTTLYTPTHPPPESQTLSSVVLREICILATCVHANIEGNAVTVLKMTLKFLNQK